MKLSKFSTEVLKEKLERKKTEIEGLEETLKSISATSILGMVSIAASLKARVIEKDLLQSEIDKREGKD